MTTATTHLPVPYQVRRLLEDLLSRPVQVRPGPPWALLHGEPGTLAIYVDHTYAIRALALCDLRFSAYAGAAAGPVERLVANRAIRERRISKDLRENLDDVLETCAGVLDVDGPTHLRLDRVCHVGADVAPQVRAMSAVLGRRLDLTVAVDGYGAGRLSFVGVG